MKRALEVTYYLHSGFSCAMGDVLLVFDYWQGEKRRLRKDKRLTGEKLSSYREVVVFVSHSHEDHFDPVVYEWGKDAGETTTIRYVISRDVPKGYVGQRVAAGEECAPFDDVHVKVFDSTDMGVSYLVEIEGVRIFHAGDLNFWHWREESTMKEIAEAEEAFRAAVEPIEKEAIDLAFFPVDQRQGGLFDAGAMYFIMTVKPRLLVPMHFWGRAEVAVEFARKSRCKQTEVVAMTRQGEKMRMDFDANDFITVNVLSAPEPVPIRAEEDEGIVNLGGYDGEDPFINTDMPIDLNGEETDGDDLFE